MSTIWISTFSDAKTQYCIFCSGFSAFSFRQCLFHTYSCLTWVATRVARWHIFKSKIPMSVNFGGSWNGKCWHILWPSGTFYCHLVHFTDIWYTLWSYLVRCTKKNLASLVATLRGLSCKTRSVGTIENEKKLTDCGRAKWRFILFGFRSGGHWGHGGHRG
jgi:hypothetical protein